tara:strand:+ start:202 stop:915 length:714 start_codon:yes stop_codon:yes gene_type:complete
MPNTNKIVLITGASSGIGKSLSLELCKKGYELILSSRNIDSLSETASRISKLGGKSHILDVDVSNEASVEQLFIKSQKIGFVDVVVNNAGFGKFDKIQDLDIHDWDRQLSVNLRGSFLVTKLFSQSMIDNKSGTIVFVNSVAGKKAYPYSSAYVASKFGLLGFSRSIREELREHNVKVISVHPGAVDTSFWENVDVDFPRAEMMSPDNVAKTIAHAISAPKNIVLEEIDIQRTEGDF